MILHPWVGDLKIEVDLIPLRMKNVTKKHMKKHMREHLKEPSQHMDGINIKLIQSLLKFPLMPI